MLKKIFFNSLCSTNYQNASKDEKKKNSLTIPEVCWYGYGKIHSWQRGNSIIITTKNNLKYVINMKEDGTSIVNTLLIGTYLRETLTHVHTKLT